MKHLFIILTFMSTMFATAAYCDNTKVRLSVDNGKDSATVVTGTISDSLDDEDMNDTASYSQPLSASSFYSEHDPMSDLSKNIVPVMGIIMGCGLPIFIVAIILWFRYKNKQAKYRLASEALAAGHPIPSELFNEPATKDELIYNKGVKNVFLGLGLGVFLWLLTEEAGLASIGFLIFCMGMGQVVIGYSSRTKDSQRVDKLDNFREEFKKNKMNDASVNEDIKETSSQEEKPTSIMDIIQAKDNKEE